MTRSTLIISLLLVMGAAPRATAHRMDLSAHAHGDTIHGHATYAGGAPVADAAVEVFDATGHVATLRTDVGGEFSYTPTSDGAHRFVVETDDAHRAEVSVDMHGVLREHLPLPASDDLRLAVQQELEPLRRQLEAYQRKVRMHDVLGGIGYIVGVIGLVAWWKARRPGSP
jgi:nickel transport protein